MTPLQKAAQELLELHLPTYLDTHVSQLRKALEAEQEKAVEPVAWWNGFRKTDIREGTSPSFSEDENTWHDIPVYTHPAPPPTIKESLKVHASAEDYMRHKYGAYRGHFAWRELEEAYSQGRYDEGMAQGPIPWPDDAPEVHYQRGYAVALSDAEEVIDDECRERVVNASDCIEIIRNLGAETEATE